MKKSTESFLSFFSSEKSVWFHVEIFWKKALWNIWVKEVALVAALG